MTLEHQLARASALAATLAAGHQDRAQAVLEALALLRVYCTDLVTARAVSIALAIWSELHDHADVVELVRIHGGVRKAARAVGVAPSTVSRRLAKVLRNATPAALPPAEPARTVGALIGITERGRGGGAGLLIHRGAPADLAPNTGGDQAMLGNVGNGSKGPALISPQAAIAVLFERLERLEKLPANAEEAAKFEGERLAIRRRLAEERFALIDLLAREGVAIARRVEKALHTLDNASGPAARVAADEVLRTVLLEQQSNSLAQEMRPAALAKELRRTADPRLRVWRAEVELEIEACACYEAPLVLYTQQEREQIKRKAEAAPVLEQDRNAPGFSPGVIVQYPRLSGAPDQKIYDGIARRKAALIDLKLWLRDEVPLQPFTADEVTREFERRRAPIPTIPDGASLMAPLPRTYTVDLSNILTKDLEPLIIGDTPREAPRDMPPDGTRYVNGVPQ